MNQHQLKSYFSFHFSTRRRLIQRQEIKHDVLKLRRRSEQPAATVWINLISDFCPGQQENPSHLDYLYPKKVWPKEMQPSKSPSAMETTMAQEGHSPVLVFDSSVVVLHSPVMVLHSLVLVFTQSSFNFYTVQFYFYTVQF